MPNPTGNSRITFRQMSMEMEREKEEQKRDKFRNITVSHTDCFSYIANPKESEKKVQEPKAMGGKKIKIRYGIKKAAGIELRFFDRKNGVEKERGILYNILVFHT